MAYHYYSTDYTYDGGPRVFSYSDIERDDLGVESLYVRVERESSSGSGFDFAVRKLPERKWTQAFGFSEDELFELENYILLNEALIWSMARGVFDEP